MKLSKELLSAGSDLWVYTPPVDFFIDKVKSNSPFSFVKQNHGTWEHIVRIFGTDYPNYPTGKELGRRYILNHALNNKEKDHVEAAAQAIADFLSLMNDADRLPENLLLGISDTGLDTSGGMGARLDSFLQTPVKDVIGLMKSFLPQDNYELYRGTIWKDYYRDGQLLKFLDAIKNKNVVYFGSRGSPRRTPPYLKNFKFVRISHTRACCQYDFMEKEIQKHHDTIIFFCTGFAQFHLIKKIHLMNNNTLIDVGQALLPYLIEGYKGKWYTVGHSE